MSETFPTDSSWLVKGIALFVLFTRLKLPESLVLLASPRGMDRQTAGGASGEPAAPKRGKRKAPQGTGPVSPGDRRPGLPPRRTTVAASDFFSDYLHSLPVPSVPVFSANPSGGSSSLSFQSPVLAASY